jgi:hypothetical protein
VYGRRSTSARAFTIFLDSFFAILPSSPTARTMQRNFSLNPSGIACLQLLAG